MKKQQKCYIYTRVSTSMQVDGYSLDAQKDKLRKYAEYQEMSIAGEYSDEGKSGKSVEGRPQFKQMLADVESGKDNVDYVLVFKLSRFGRNAADVLSSLQKMQDYGVNLICVEDGIDSSKDVGKLMISVLSAVAEIERENILVQTIEGFSTSFVKGVLDNPIYCGKLAFGRRKNEKIPGTRNEYHIVKQKDYLLSDGVHEAIISEEMWNQAHRKRQETGVLQVKTHSLEHEHILSGIIKCPVCGSGMYGNVNRKKHPDGGYYKDYFYYACKHRKLVDGHRCTYKRQWNEDRINAAVEEIIRKFVKNPKFEQEIRKQIGSSIDTSELDKEYDGLKDRLSQTTGAKNRLADQMDHLSVSDKNYDKKYNDMQERLDKLYDEITDIEDAMEEVETRLYNIRQDKISEDNVYQFLLFFDKLYDKFTDLEKKTFLKSFLSDVFIYEEEQKDGRILKGLRFKFPIYMNGRNVLGVDWDNESTDETVVKLSLKKDTPKIEVTMKPDEESNYTPEEKARYPKIKEYVKNKYGVNVHTSYIAQVKRMCGLDMGENYNKSKKKNPEVKQCPQEKVEYIKDALRYFKLI
jgi:DNA invertase Pin-like site-specific DNA recombinase/archaellum component FlaC